MEGTKVPVTHLTTANSITYELLGFLFWLIASDAIESSPVWDSCTEYTEANRIGSLESDSSRLFSPQERRQPNQHWRYIQTTPTVIYD
jgi:hypothetical protein